MITMCTEKKIEKKDTQSGMGDWTLKFGLDRGIKSEVCGL